MPQRLNGGKILIGLGAAVLFVSLFLNWYGDIGFDGEAASAWTTFEIVDLLLAIVALAALLGVAGTIVPQATLQRLPAWTLGAVGPVAFVLVTVSLIDKPPAASSASIDYGAWLAFAASGLMTVGAVLAVARVSLVISVSERQPRDDRRDDPDDVPPTG